MTRHHPDWLSAFLDYAGHGEAPPHMYFWSAVSAVAGVLRRRCWIERGYDKWYPNFYICLVAPPGVVAKSTTAGIAMNLLRRVPDIKFGPDVVTWPALVTAFAGAAEAYEYEGAYHTMSAMTLESSELGNLLDTRDRQMVNLLISLWDGKQGAFRKETKNNGNDEVQNPWINLIACTTPAWIADNIPEYMLGGGLCSRIVFVYAEKKAKLVAYPERQVPSDLSRKADYLVEDLTAIAQLPAGPFTMTESAYKFGEDWYRDHNTNRPINLANERFSGGIARKQVQMHKLAMVISAATSDSKVITAEHLQTAYTMMTDLEPDMQFVFSKIGRSDSSLHIERLLAFIHFRGRVSFPEAYRHVHAYFTSVREFEDALAGCVRAGYIKLEKAGDNAWLSPGQDLPRASNGRGGRVTPQS